MLIRYRAQDFAKIAHSGGETSGWPFPYEELEPWYCRAEQLYEVRGAQGRDATEPPHSQPYPFPAVPDEPVIAVARERMKRVGLHSFSLPLGNIQLLDRVTAPNLKGNIPLAPEWALGALSRHSVDWCAMSEDLPNPGSRVTVGSGRIYLDWRCSNWAAPLALVATFKQRLRAAGCPLVLTSPLASGGSRL